MEACDPNLITFFSGIGVLWLSLLYLAYRADVKRSVDLAVRVSALYAMFSAFLAALLLAVLLERSGEAGGRKAVGATAGLTAGGVK